MAGLCTSGCSSSSLAPSAVPAQAGPGTIQAENAKPGATDWRLTDRAKNGEIDGYASRSSVDRGEDISIYVSTAEPAYKMQIFRMGWYGGAGAREMMPAVIRSGIRQPAPSVDPETHLVECHWRDPFVLHIAHSTDPTDWPSGVYLVKLTAQLSGKQNYVIFVVRDDRRRSDLLFQVSVATFQAYNAWGGWSLYTNPQAFKVSFDRPYKEGDGAGFFLEWEYNTVRFLEREGYDVTYSTDIDTDTRGQLLLQHKAFLVVGHDEYWSWQMRDNVDHARDSGVNLGFFAADTSYWQIRFEPSTVTGVPDRVIVCYKSATLDPMSQNPATSYLTTTAFRDPPVNRPEDALVGVMYEGWIQGAPQDMVVKDASSWIFAGTGVQDGAHLPGMLGYECDRMYGRPPAGTQCVAHSPWQDGNGQTFYSDMVSYVAPSGSTVVSTGSMNWNWGLDSFISDHAEFSNPVVQQATRNILARFGAADPAIIRAGKSVQKAHEEDGR